MRVLVTGSTGFIGANLVPALHAAGHEVLAMTRDPDSYHGVGRPIAADLGDPEALRRVLAGVEVAYYLIHGLDENGGTERDTDLAEAFGHAAAAAGVTQIVYLGGLGAEGDDLSDHLASRREVEGRLGLAGVPVTVLRAALVIGAGSASFELLRQVVAHLPVLAIPPRAEQTRVQPVALEDAVRYLLAVAGNPATLGRVFEIGGPDVLSYAELMRRMAHHLDQHRPSVPLPPLPDLLTRWGISAVTDIDPQLALTLLDSLGNDVVITDRPLHELIPGDRTGVDAMLTSALAARSEPEDRSI